MSSCLFKAHQGFPFCLQIKIQPAQYGSQQVSYSHVECPFNSTVFPSFTLQMPSAFSYLYVFTLYFLPQFLSLFRIQMKFQILHEVSLYQIAGNNFSFPQTPTVHYSSLITFVFTFFHPQYSFLCGFWITAPKI